MMTIAGVLLLAVMDSVNPSAIVVTLYLLSIARSRALVQVPVYVGAIFITHLVLVYGLTASPPQIPRHRELSHARLRARMLHSSCWASASRPWNCTIALLAGHLVLQKRLVEPYAALRQRLESGARETMLWVAGLVGGWLFVTGTIELMVRLR